MKTTLLCCFTSPGKRQTQLIFSPGLAWFTKLYYPIKKAMHLGDCDEKSHCPLIFIR